MKLKHPSPTTTAHLMITMITMPEIQLLMMRYVHSNSIPLSLIVVLLAFTLSFCTELRAETGGQKLYLEKCAACHGESGQGVKSAGKALRGTLAVPQLSDVIRRTMPEDDPGSLSEAEATSLAAYLHQNFYSIPEANSDVRIQLSRLTVSQYRQSVADLVGSFRWSPKADEEHGLQAEYFRARKLNSNERVLKRIDSQIDFDFGTGPSLAEKIEPHQFSMRWQGSLIAPETGNYEIVIHTEHAAKFWLNDVSTPLIDAWVKSGDDVDYKTQMFLVEGRRYPLKLEFSKSVQGVGNAKNKKGEKEQSSISLRWKRPGKTLEPVPTTSLSPGNAPEVFICSSTFPPDDRSYGWERGTAISQAWDAATTDAAIETADYISTHLNELAKTNSNDSNRAAKLTTFCEQFAERAFGEPLSDNLKKLYIQNQFAGDGPPEAAVKRVVLLVLKSPRFLYHGLGHNSDDNGNFQTAALLSYGLWNSVPDQQLLNAARNNQLKTREQISGQLRRMLKDDRAKTKLNNFLLVWLGVDQPHDLQKDSKRFPDFDPEIVTDLHTSLELFLDEVLWSENADFRKLLLAEDLYLNKRLADFYATGADTSKAFVKVGVESSEENQQRAGVLTHPFLLTRLADPAESSPIHRGVFVARHLLGISLKPPPEAVTPLPADLHPALTTRERVILQTDSATCMTCHGIINQLGFPLEHFDAVGRYRPEDNKKNVDAGGQYRTATGKMMSVSNARQLAEFLAESEEVHAAFVEQMFHHLIQQPVRAFGTGMQPRLQKSFADNKFNIRELAITILTEAALNHPQRKPETTKPK